MSACHASSVQYHRHFVAFMHVVGACHDLYGLASYIHLADNQLICIRMLFNLVNLAYHDLRKIRVQFFISFYLCSG